MLKRIHLNFCRMLALWFQSRDKQELEITKRSNAQSFADVKEFIQISYEDMYNCTPYHLRESNKYKRENENSSNFGKKSEPNMQSLVVESELSLTPEPACQDNGNSLVFNSEFESGNLEKAIRVFGRETFNTFSIPDRKNESIGLSPPPSHPHPYPTRDTRNTPTDIHTLHHVSITPPFHEIQTLPHVVDQEYDLFLRNDLHTKGHIQWYYFSVKTPQPMATSGSGIVDNIATPVSYPLSVRFNIVNMMKEDALYNYGMRPVVYSTLKAQECGHDRVGSEYKHASLGWHHDCYDICYYRNNRTYTKSKAKNNSFNQHKLCSTLTFTYIFRSPDDTVYFSHCYPYTYSDLNTYLNTLESDSRISQFLRKKLLCYTLASNRCDLITITSPSANQNEFLQRPAVFITSRVHPGETMASYAMEGLLDFLTSDTSEAIKLRDAYIFKIVPMLNPDGVIHGNYRCSLAGVDLNRQYLNPNVVLHPTIHALKNLIIHTSEHRGVSLFLDIHGHSQHKNVFLYGCDSALSHLDTCIARDTSTDNILSTKIPHIVEETDMLSKRVFARVFPKVLETISEKQRKSENRPSSYFCFDDCALHIQKSKIGTGRVVCWSSIAIHASFTVEISFCGSGTNSETKLFKIFEEHLKKELISQRSQSNKILSYAADGNNTGKTPINFFVGSKGKIDIHENIFRRFKMYNSLLKLLDIYKVESHYSQLDLRKIGAEMGLGILAYSNMDSENYSSVQLMNFRQNKTNFLNAKRSSNSVLRNSKSSSDILAVNASLRKMSLSSSVSCVALPGTNKSSSSPAFNGGDGSSKALTIPLSASDIVDACNLMTAGSQMNSSSVSTIANSDRRKRVILLQSELGSLPTPESNLNLRLNQLTKLFSYEHLSLPILFPNIIPSDMVKHLLLRDQFFNSNIEYLQNPANFLIKSYMTSAYGKEAKGNMSLTSKDLNFLGKLFRTAMKNIRMYVEIELRLRIMRSDLRNAGIDGEIECDDVKGSALARDTFTIDLIKQLLDQTIHFAGSTSVINRDARYVEYFKEMCRSNHGCNYKLYGNYLDDEDVTNIDVTSSDVDGLTREPSDEEGSDSDPSGDDLPISKILRNSSFLSLENFSNRPISTYIRKYKRKNSKYKKKRKRNLLPAENAVLNMMVRPVTAGRTQSNVGAVGEENLERKMSSSGTPRATSMIATSPMKKAISSAPHRRAIAESLKWQTTLNNRLHLEKSTANIHGQNVPKAILRIRNFSLNHELLPQNATQSGNITVNNSHHEFQDINTRKESRPLVSKAGSYQCAGGGEDINLKRVNIGIFDEGVDRTIPMPHTMRQQKGDAIYSNAAQGLRKVYVNVNTSISSTSQGDNLTTTEGRMQLSSSSSSFATSMQNSPINTNGKSRKSHISPALVKTSNNSNGNNAAKKGILYSY